MEGGEKVFFYLHTTSGLKRREIAIKSWEEEEDSRRTFLLSTHTVFLQKILLCRHEKKENFSEYQVQKE